MRSISGYYYKMRSTTELFIPHPLLGFGLGLGLGVGLRVRFRVKIRVRVKVRAVTLTQNQTSRGLHLGRCESSDRPHLGR